MSESKRTQSIGNNKLIAILGKASHNQSTHTIKQFLHRECT